MKRRVPEFQMGDHDFSLPTFCNPTRPRKCSLADDDDDVVELLWQNGQVVTHSQSHHRSLRRSPQSEQHQQPHELFMQEHEMASWLNYPLLEDHHFGSDLLLPPLPPARTSQQQRESMVDSCDTPSVGPESRLPKMPTRMLGEAAAAASFLAADGAGEKQVVCQLTLTSSPDGSTASAELDAPKLAVDDRKRKGRATDDIDCQSDDVEYNSADPKKHLRGSTSTKRSRAAEVHNLSERRRRDRINEKMKALQELIPRCNKTDKASMLDEAIEYLKALQLQVQMMSMGCGMMPMMFLGVQQYLQPPMGMGIGMGMGMGMEMGMNSPMMQFPNLLAGSNLPMQAGAAATAGHLGPRFPLPAFAMPPVPGSDPSRAQATNNQPNPMFNSAGTQNTTPPSGSGFPDSYQQFFSSNHMQLHMTQILQNQQPNQPTMSRPCTGRGPKNLENHESGRVQDDGADRSYLAWLIIIGVNVGWYRSIPNSPTSDPFPWFFSWTMVP